MKTFEVEVRRVRIEASDEEEAVGLFIEGLASGEYDSKIRATEIEQWDDEDFDPLPRSA